MSKTPQRPFDRLRVSEWNLGATVKKARDSGVDREKGLIMLGISRR